MSLVAWARTEALGGKGLLYVRMDGHSFNYKVFSYSIGNKDLY